MESAIASAVLDAAQCRAKPALRVAPAALALLLAATQSASAQCIGETYSYGSGACSTCATNATFVSSASSCVPASAPTDTAFYLSGSRVEGASALTLATGAAAPAFVVDHAGAASGALSFASGSYLSAAGASAPAALPGSGSVAWSASAWVQCAAPAATWASVLEWGPVGDSGGAASHNTMRQSIRP